MARRKRFFRKGLRKSSGFGFGKVTKILTGAALAALYEVFISPRIPIDGMIKNIVELVGGIMLGSMSSMPMPVRAFGVALATINAYALIIPYVQNYAGNGSDTSVSSW